MLHRRRFSQKRNIQEMMENHMATKPRKKFWFVFFILFVFWYLLLYGFNWSYLSGLSLTSHNQEKLDSNSVPATTLNHSSSNVSRNVTVDHGEKYINVSSIENDEIEDLEGLQKDMEPLLPQDEEYSDVKDGRTKRSCNGRYIYVHNLPVKFNNELIEQCKLLNKWHNMCPYFENLGLGQGLGNPQKLFLSSGWFVTHQFSLEVIFHNRMKQYECLTDDSSKAAAIFVPYYAGLDISRYLWGYHNFSTRDAYTVELIKWLREKPEWKVMGGRDHFLVAGRITWDFRRGIDEDSGWGNKLMVLPESQNMTMLTIESSPWNDNDFAIPYPTYFHPWNDDEVFQWQSKMRKQKKRALFCFVGAPRPNMKESIRGEIMEQCINASRRKCRMLECKDKNDKCIKPVNVMKLFQTSVFCLQPPGDSFTRRSTFDSILAGCIPVFFHPGSAYVQYLWHLPKNYNTYSVLIPEDDVKNKKVNIDRVLSRIPKSKVLAMREEVIKLIPKVIYADPRSRLKTVEDAFDLTVNGVIERVEALRREIREGRNSSNEFDKEYSWKYYAFGTTKQHEWDHFFKRTNRIKY